MINAQWYGAVIAQSDRTIEIEGNHYFPPDSVDSQFLHPSDTHSTCPWKGLASYYNIKIDGKINKDAAWYYPEPKEAASEIKGYIAFWKGVTVSTE